MSNACPECGHKTHVLNVRKRKGIVRRQRECLSPLCKHRFFTSETFRKHTGYVPPQTFSFYTCTENNSGIEL